MCRKRIYLISFILLVGLAFSNIASADPNLVGWWKFDGDASDSSGHNRDGTLNGNPTFATGKFGQAINLDGVGDFVSVGSVGISGTVPRTIAGWVKMNTLTIPDWTHVFGFLTSTPPAQFTGFDIMVSGGNAPPCPDGWYVITIYWWQQAILGPDLLWHHFAATYDGTKIRWYGDGQFVGEEVHTLNTNDNVQIGASGFSGLIDDVSIYNRALSGSEIKRLANPEKASIPIPADGSTYDGINVTLAWDPGLYAATTNGHHVYFGNVFSDVNQGIGGTDKGFRTPPNYPIAGLIPGTTYYWRIDEVNSITPPNLWKGNVWSFSVQPLKATNPSPPDGDVLVDPNGILSWSKGMKAANVNGHRVYFDSVKAKVIARSGCAVNGVSRTDPNYIFGSPLTLGGTYYWAIDEVNVTTWPGDVWSFTTWPNIPITDPNLVGWWKFDDSEGGKTLDSSGHNRHGTLHGDPNYATGMFDEAISLDGIDDWVDVGSVGISGAAPRTIAGWAKMNTTTIPGWTNVFGFQGSTTYYTFFDIVVSGDNAPPVPGGWYAIHTYYWQQPIIGPDLEWHHLAATYDGTTIRWYGDGQLVGEQIYTIDTNDNVQIGKSASYFPGLIDDVRIYNKVLTQTEIGKILSSPKATVPNPANRAVVPPGAISLTWVPGNKAVTHDVYFSDNIDAVSDANSSDPSGPNKVYKGRQDPNSYGPINLELDQTYYWRIDEVNDPNIWRGSVWRFTVPNYIPVDDFESYDNTFNIIYQTWIKGGGGTVGYPDPNYAEVTIVHEGAQSMPFDYNNLKSPNYSEATRTFATAQDWTTYGSYSLKALALWFRGYPVSVGSFVESPAGTYTITASGTDIWDVSPTRGGGFHDEFHYAYKDVTAATELTDPIDQVTTFNGVRIKAKVESVSNTDPWAKAGAMIRNSLDPNSTHGMMCVSATSGDSFQQRLETGGVSTSTDIAETAAPYWVMLDLDANYGNIRAYHSPTGADGTWTQVGGAVQPLDREGNPAMILPRSSPLYVGLAATAHNAAATCTAKLSNVTITAGGTLGAWDHRDIGIKSNIASPLYVTLEDSTSPTPKTATVTYPDPNIVLQNTWQEWNIALSDFTGVNLTKIKKITIGVGNKQPGGTGTLYFDDIRLYIPRCMPALLKPAADFTDDCKVDDADLQILANNWLISDYQVTLAAPSDANLVAHYTFDDNTFNDSSPGPGHKNNGEPNGATIVTDPVRGKVASFDGVNDYVNCSNDVSLDITGKITLSAWVKTNDCGNSQFNPYIAKGDYAYTLQHHNTNVLEFSIYDAAAWYFAHFPVNSSFNNNWHHLAGTYDGSQVKLYVDGELAGSSAHTGSIAIDNANLNLGRSSDYTDRLYNGALDDVRIYSRALSHNEIASLAGKTAQFTQPLYLLLTPQNSGIDLYNDGRIDLRDYAVLADVWLEVILWP